MKSQHFTKSLTNRKRIPAGDALLDALIAMLLVAVIGLGPAYVMSRSAVAQTQSLRQNMAVVEMRKLLSEHGPALCESPMTTEAQADVDAASTLVGLPIVMDCTDRSSIGIEIGGHAINPVGTGAAKTVSLSIGANSDDEQGQKSKMMFGGGGVISIKQDAQQQ